MLVRHCHSSFAFLLVTLALGASSTAYAQAWLSDRDRAEGSGIRIGNVELHPGIGAEVGYLSNVYNADKNPDSTPALRLAPHLMLSTLSEERLSGGDTDAPPQPGFVEFRGGLSGSLLHYFSTLPQSLTVIGTSAEFELTLAPKRPVSFAITESFTRTAQPFTESGLPAGSTADPPSYARDLENIGGKFIFSTPGGLLTGGLGYRFSYDYFEESAFQTNNSMTHSVGIDGNWEFLPKTAIFYEGSYSRQGYTTQSASDQRTLTTDAMGVVNETGAVSDNHQVSSRVGLNGAITPHIGATLGAGYTVVFSDYLNDVEGPSVNAELRYFPSEQTEIALGYDRAITSAFQGGGLTRDRIATRARVMFGGAAMLNAKAGVEFLKFGKDPSQSDIARSDRRYFGDVSGEYRFVDWLAVTGQGGVVVDDTDFVFVSSSGRDPAKYTSFEAWLGLRAFY